MTAPNRLAGRQHDDHCILTFQGVNWRIAGMQGLGHILLVSLDGMYQGHLCLAQADMDAYVARAVEWLEPAMAIDNAELVS